VILKGLVENFCGQSKSKMNLCVLHLYHYSKPLFNDFTYRYEAKIVSVCLSRWWLAFKQQHQHIKCLKPSAHHLCTSSLFPQVDVVSRLPSTTAWRWRSGENSSNTPSKTTAIYLNGQCNWLAFRRSWVQIQVVNRFFWIFLQTRFFRIQLWQHCYFAFQARIETGLKQNWMHVIWEINYGDY